METGIKQDIGKEGETAGQVEKTKSIWRERALLGIGLGIISIICFMPSLNFALYSDDFGFISKSREIIEDDPFQLFQVSTYRDFLRPTVYIIYYISYRLFGLNPLYYHLVLLLAHLLASLALYRLINLASGAGTGWPRTMTVLSTLYFFSHFRTHQAIFWYSGIKQVLSVVFGLASIYLLMKMVKGSPDALYMLDKEMGTRVFTPPPAKE